MENIQSLVEKIINPEAKRFLETFLRNRNVNREYYRRVPEDKMDFHMIDTPQRKSDSPKESLIHQLYVTRNYVYSLKEGCQEWSDERYKELIPENIASLSKTQLLEELEMTEGELIHSFLDPQIQNKTVKVPWSKIPIPSTSSLWGLNDHEILHTGWNLAVMDHLGMERFDLLKHIWG